MSEKEFKKLMIDLDLTLSAIGRACSISPWTVQRYFRNELRNTQRRSQIRGFLARRALKLEVHLPEFWTEDNKAA